MGRGTQQVAVVTRTRESDTFKNKKPSDLSDAVIRSLSMRMPDMLRHLARSQHLQPALYSALRGVSVLVWEVQMMAVWRAWQQDVSKAALSSGQPLLVSHGADRTGIRGSDYRESEWTAEQQALTFTLLQSKGLDAENS